MIPGKEIISSYGLDPNSVTIETIDKGLINATWQIKDQTHHFILQRINHNVFKNPEAIASNLRLIADYLSRHYPGYLLATPVQTMDHEEMKFVKSEGYFRLIPFVKDSHTIATVEEPEQAYEAAKKFGEFTKLLSGFPVGQLQNTIPDFHNLSLRYDQFMDALQSGNRDRIKQSEELILFLKNNKKIADTYEHILQNPSFRLRVTHHDTKISNVLFNEDDKGICVIDLDTVMAGYFISDIGDMMRTYLSPANEEEKDFSKVQVREDYFKSIWDGYMEEMKNELTEDERQHFIYAGKFMIYMQALRFLADHLNNDVYYGSKYEGHNFVRAGNQIVLLQRLIEKEELLKSLIESK